jgi:hypothetical protein
MRPIAIVVSTLAALTALLAAGSVGAQRDDAAARFDAQGRMLFPADYREWVFLSAGRGMSYSPMAMEQPAPPFDNVFVNRAAYRSFRENGTWPDGTVLVLEIRGGTSHGSILQGGSFQTGEPLGIEVHVKDTARFGGDGWAFFGFDGEQPSAMIPREANCYSCHEANTAVDRTFVQFYPTLLPIARGKGTLTPAYVARETAEGASAAH